MKTHYHQLRRKVLRYLLQCGDYGATDFEIWEHLGEIRDSVRPRRIELRDAGLVIASGHTRPSEKNRPCTVWIVAPTVTMAEYDAKQTLPRTKQTIQRPPSPPTTMPAADPRSPAMKQTTLFPVS